ncbi:hypothetical protein WA026_002028 [Henosepilachna vigintioctopunctata]|uniref:Uncharacterized protein n=1 Tax=Henosepilachna vigintioctopunctata TaxID=420089 RepID=A0AAW1UVG6_9CUCU
MIKIKYLPLSGKTVQDRMAKISPNVAHLHTEDIQLASALLLSVNESGDIKCSAHIAILSGICLPRAQKEKFLRFENKLEELEEGLGEMYIRNATKMDSFKRDDAS